LKKICSRSSKNCRGFVENQKNICAEYLVEFGTHKISTNYYKQEK